MNRQDQSRVLGFLEQQQLQIFHKSALKSVKTDRSLSQKYLLPEITKHKQILINRQEIKFKKQQMELEQLKNNNIKFNYRLIERKNIDTILNQSYYTIPPLHINQRRRRQEEIDIENASMIGRLLNKQSKLKEQVKYDQNQEQLTQRISKYSKQNFSEKLKLLKSLLSQATNQGIKKPDGNTSQQTNYYNRKLDFSILPSDSSQNDVVNLKLPLLKGILDKLSQNSQ